VRHPQHDAVVEAVRSWYRRSYPEMGYLIEERRFGWYGNAGPAASGRVTLRDVTPELVRELLDDVDAYYGGLPVSLFVDDREADAALRPALQAEGAEAGPGNSYLAYGGPPPEAPPLPGVTLEYATEASLREYAVTKLKGFANSEDAPSEQQVAVEIAMRQAEAASDGRFLIARAEGDAASIAGWYTNGAHIFQLATRVPFRRRGIATALLRHILREELSQGTQAVVINADEDDHPIEIYRRLGFTDEVYWRRPYRVAAR
jgi:ribosomal protein S18 acetylase RimI-like enzyme